MCIYTTYIYLERERDADRCGVSGITQINSIQPFPFATGAHVAAQDSGLASAVATAAALRRKRTADLFQKLRTIAPLVGRIRRFLMLLHDTVHFRPGGLGQKRCRDEFERCARACIYMIYIVLHAVPLVLALVLVLVLL